MHYCNIVQKQKANLSHSTKKSPNQKEIFMGHLLKSGVETISKIILFGLNNLEEKHIVSF